MPIQLQRRWRSCLLRSVFGVVLLIAPLAIQGETASQGCAGVYAAEPPRPPVTAELAPGTSHAYPIRVAEDRQVRVLLESDEPAIAVTVCSPDGTLTTKSRATSAGILPVSFASTRAGTYVVNVEVGPEATDTTGYRLRWEIVPYQRLQFKAELAAEASFREAQRQRNRPFRTSIRRALTLYDQARRSWAEANNADGQQVALIGGGDSYLALSSYGEALRAYQMARSVPGSRDKAEALVALAHLYVDKQDPANARGYAEQALTAARENSDRRCEAAAFIERGQSLFLQSKDSDAMRDFETALSIATAERDRLAAARALEGIAYVHSDLGNPARTAEYLDRAARLWRQMGDVHDEVNNLNVRAIAFALGGDRQRALEMHRSALRLLEQMGDRRRSAAALGQIGEAYLALKQARTGIDYLRRSLAGFEAVHLSGGRVMDLGNLCVAHQTLGEARTALQYCESAVAAVPQLHDARRESVELRYLGDVYAGLGQTSKADELYTRAVALSRTARDPRGEADALRSLGKLRASAGDNNAALELFAKALPLSEAGEDPEGAIAAHYEIARAQRAKGALAAAREEVEEALRLAEEQRSKVGSEALRSSYFTSVRQSYELDAQVLMELHNQQPEAGLDRSALEQSEKAHARTLLDALAERGGEADPARDPQMAQRMRGLRAKIEAASYERMRLLAYGGSRKQLDANIERIRLLNAEYDAVRSASREAGTAATPERIPSLSVEQIQKEALDPETTLLEYLLGDEGSIGWAVTQGRVVSFALPPRRALESDVQRWHALMLARKPRAGESAESYGQRVRRADGELQAVAAKLACALVGPAMPQLGTRRLAIVPDGGLEYIAFGALPLDGCGDRPAEPLVSRFEVVVVPSASSVVALRRDVQTRPEATSGIAVLADPVFTADDPRVGGTHPAAVRPHVPGPLGAAMRDLGWNSGIPRLPGTRLEAKTIAARAPAGGALVALDFEASVATALRPELSRYRILHFATHGLLDTEQPEFSGLILSLVDRKGKDENGYLSAQEIYEQHLSAELVVLSACDSGLGATLRGEGVVGLARAFLHAGAARVVSSLWKVDDDATSELMRHFYDGMLRDRKPPAAALRYAQMQMMRQKRWSAPFYWAGFVLNGEWR